uniref:Uncharacterized protein n=1 Tax=Arundo donax TaxID=35708 RepID=A0A0A8YGB9_ARUDO
MQVTRTHKQRCGICHTRAACMETPK